MKNYYEGEFTVHGSTSKQEFLIPFKSVMLISKTDKRILCNHYDWITPCDSYEFRQFNEQYLEWITTQ